MSCAPPGRWTQKSIKQDCGGAERAGVRFSWQVTGIRNDPFARENPVLVEEEKGEANGFKPGTYMHLSAYGVSKPK